jgi:hypothetical protein
VPTYIFAQSPINLAWGSSIYAKVVAVNIRGSSDGSEEGNGAVILTNPDAPLSVSNDPSVTTDTVIGLKWLEGAQNGGSPVIDYKISSTTGTNPYITLDSGVTTLSYQAINLTPGTVYKFRIQARNRFGFSAVS